MNSGPVFRSCRRCDARLAWDNQDLLCGSCRYQARNILIRPPAVPAAFWDTTQMQEALSTHHMGVVVRAFRNHPDHGLPISQSVAAGWLHLTQSQLSRIEGGPPIRDLHRLTQWAHTLHIPAHLLWFVPAEQDESHHDATPDEGHHQATDPAEAEPQAAPLSPYRPVHAYDGNETDQLAGGVSAAGSLGMFNALSGDEYAMKRRALLELLAALGAGQANPPGALEEILGGIDRALSDHTDVDDWERAVIEYAHRIVRQPVGSLIEPLGGDVIILGGLLERRHPPLVQADLLRASARLSGLLAVEFSDVGNQRAARTSWGTARRAADASGDRHLSAWVRAVEADQAFWARSPRPVVTALAEEAITTAKGTPCPGLARAQSVQAMLAVEDGDEAGARESIAAATKTYSQVPEQIARDQSCLGYPQGRLHLTEAYVRALANDTRQAHAVLDQGMNWYATDAVAPMADLRLTRSLVLVKDREIDTGLHDAVTTLQAGPPSAKRRHVTSQILKSLPPKARTLPAAQELRTLATK